MNNLDCLVDIKDLTYRYERENVLENIDLCIPKGAFIGLVGPNGSGKSTLIRLLLGLLKVQEGKINLFGIPAQSFQQRFKIGYVSQKANSFNTGFPATVSEVVGMGLVSKMGFFRFYRKQDKEKIRQALETVGMEKYAGRNIGELSGGQQQRVFIARALVSEPELLILDEPTVGVDAKNVKSFYGLLKKLHEDGITILLVTHDIGTITEQATHIACLNKKMFFHGDACEFDELKDDELSSFYGHQLQTLTHEH
ncbi:metal ABC transporter ATP-binding protein [Bacillus marinisedimentorum]|uniref:metal ABC transporter ATP-binding protein n=1 Tax=Bacillus marinisedimentorum TaxID=1821260 RepID=UPI0008728551|nr:ABC transporter ATP-binding protein [Bacillus marinisedimentorum]